MFFLLPYRRRDSALLEEAVMMQRMLLLSPVRSEFYIVIILGC